MKFILYLESLVIKIPVLALNSLDLKLVSSLTGCVTLSGLMNLSESLFATLLKVGVGWGPVRSPTVG